MCDGLRLFNRPRRERRAPRRVLKNLLLNGSASSRIIRLANDHIRYSTSCQSRLSGAVPYESGCGFFCFPAGPSRMETKRHSGRSACGKKLNFWMPRFRKVLPALGGPGGQAATPPVPSNATCAVARGSASLSMTFFSKQPNAIEAEASACTTLRANGTAPPERVPEGRWPCFEGAHFIRRCAPFSTSAHLGKPRRFLRRCAPFSKVRTKSAHLRFWRVSAEFCAENGVLGAFCTQSQI
jgi:hypothetical protein